MKVTNPKDKNFGKHAIELINPEEGQESIIYVHPIDAKESLATGRYKYVTGDNRKSIKDDSKNDDSKKIEEVNIDSLNSKGLIEFMGVNGIEIAGFHNLNLLEKREAVKNSLLKPIEHDL